MVETMELETKLAVVKKLVELSKTGQLVVVTIDDGDECYLMNGHLQLHEDNSFSLYGDWNTRNIQYDKIKIEHVRQLFISVLDTSIKIH